MKQTKTLIQADLSDNYLSKTQLQLTITALENILPPLNEKIEKVRKPLEVTQKQVENYKEAYLKLQAQYTQELQEFEALETEKKETEALLEKYKHLRDNKGGSFINIFAQKPDEPQSINAHSTEPRKYQKQYRWLNEAVKILEEVKKPLTAHQILDKLKAKFAHTMPQGKPYNWSIVPRDLQRHAHHERKKGKRLLEVYQGDQLVLPAWFADDKKTLMPQYAGLFKKGPEFTNDKTQIMRSET